MNKKDKGPAEIIKNAGLFALTALGAYAAIKHGQAGMLKKYISQAMGMAAGVEKNIAMKALRGATKSDIPISQAIGYLLNDTPTGKWISSFMKKTVPGSILEKILHLREFKLLAEAPAVFKIKTPGDMPALKNLVEKGVIDASQPIYSSLGKLYSSATGAIKEIDSGYLPYFVSPNKPGFFQKGLAKASGNLYNIEYLKKRIKNLIIEWNKNINARPQIEQQIKDIANQIRGLERLQEPKTLLDRVKNVLGISEKRGGSWKQEITDLYDTIKNFLSPERELDTQITSWGVVKRATYDNVVGKPLRALLRGDWREAYKLSILGAGAGDMRGVNTFQQMIHFIFERMNRNIRRSPAAFLALPEQDVSTLGALAVNTMLKRILPLSIAYKMISYAFFESDKLTGGYGIKRQIGNTWQAANLTLATVFDVTGVNKVLAHIGSLSPRRQVGDKHPGMSRKELSHYYDQGIYPIRKGRFWPISSTPWVGGRVDYFAPPWSTQLKQPTRNIMIYGSEEGAWKYSWFPTPRYPFAPLARIFDPYRIERINYYERPYPITGPLFSPHTPWGGILNATIGRIIKPPHRMHDEDMRRRGRQYIPSIYQNYYLRFTPSGSNRLYARQLHAGYTGNDIAGAVPGGSPTFSSGDKIIAGRVFIHKVRGGVKIYNIKKKYSHTIPIIKSDLLGDEYKHIKKLSYGIPMSGGTHIMAPVRDYSEPLTEEQIKPRSPFNLGYGIRQGYYNWARMAGIYGFIGGTIAEKFGFMPYTGSRVPVLQHAGNIQSAERYYYEDLGIGGLDPFNFSVSEIGRRFLTHKMKMNLEYNPIPNMAPGWLPGEDYFQNFRVGDMYAKIPRGEYRLPGKLYEELHNIDIFNTSVGPSILSRSKEDLYRYLTDQQFAATLRQEQIMESGTALHKKIERELIREGVAKEAEHEFRNKKYNIHGFVDVVAQSGQPIEIKTVSSKELEDIIANGPREEHERQLAFYIDQLKQKSGKLLYVSRDDPSKRRVFEVKANPAVVREMLSNLQSVRAKIKEQVKNHAIPRGNLYPLIERLNILADVAPWSQEYHSVRKQISQIESLSPEARDRVQKIRKIATERRRKYDFTRYKYAGKSVASHSVSIESMIDPVTFYAKGFKHPFRLDGVKIKSSKRVEAIEFLKTRLYPGAGVRVTYETPVKVSNDTYNTIRVAIGTGGGDLGRQLVEKGLAEYTGTGTAAATHSRTSAIERTGMAVIERIAHAPGPWHSKLWPWDTALEYYRRQKVMAPEWREWSKPYSHHIKPTIHSFGSEGAFTGSIVGGIMGALLASQGYRETGMIIGAALGGASAIYQSAATLVTGEKWIPKRAKDERELKEYFDMLRYVKYERLYTKYRGMVLSKYGYDIEKRISALEKAGKERMMLKRNLEEEKRKQKRLFSPGSEEKIKEINARLREIKETSGITELSPLEAIAYQYRKKMKQTMYGADPYGPMQDVMAALPRDEKMFFTEFVTADENERREIWDIAPRYMRRFLAPYYGVKPPNKLNIKKYFRSHYLPKGDWEGWREDVDLEGVMMKTGESYGFKPEEIGYFPEEQIRYQDADSLDIRKRGGDYYNPQTIDVMLHRTLAALGLKTINYNVIRVPADTNTFDIKINISSNRNKEVQRNIGDYV